MSAMIKLTRYIYKPIFNLVRNRSVQSLLQSAEITGSKIKIKGWVKGVRRLKHVTFLAVSDGSCLRNLQVVVPSDNFTYPVAATYGSCVEVTGALQKSQGADQEIDLLADSVHVVGKCDPMEYPFKAKKQHPPDYSRQFPHIRPRSTSFSSLLRVRNALARAVHQYLQNKDYLQIHTPVITSNDCEGAGEVFKVEPADAAVMAEMENEEGTGITEHFFGVPSFLTVSGQLHLEVMTGAFTKVYTFGPTFRAENSRGRHHLSEFYMLEAELAFVDNLDQLLQTVEALLKTSCHLLIDSTENDVQWHWENVATNSKSQQKKFEKMITREFIRMSYTEAISILDRHQDQFKFSVKWGCDLKKEHERYLVQHCGDVPVFVTDFPADIKPFYMKANEDNITVAAMDLLLPDVGEVCGGSLRENEVDVLQERLQKLDLTEELDWYLDLRRFGGSPHCGFGLGFERCLQAILGISNIRDTIPFPRSPNNCKL